MKLCRNNVVKPCKCGSFEFITEPNRYDIYEIIDGSLELVNSENTDEEFKLYCRECGEKLKNATDYVKNSWKRNYISCEIHPEYYQMILDRLKNGGKVFVVFSLDGGNCQLHFQHVDFVGQNGHKIVT
ncbi:hypothetical protein FACS1894178_4350 [Bacteroidia bacterium]|nr:hypothetical protein FACS1894178_4350 [Bacteroidia bacterium]